MKLKKVDKNAWMKCCRYCKHFSSGCCTNPDNITFGEDLSVYKVAEDGHLALTLEETFGSVNIVKEFRELESLLREFNISDKRISKVSDCLRHCWGELREKLQAELDDKVSMCYANHITDDSSFGNVYIENPESFCCKDWC